MEAAITAKGQATIPKASREHLGLKPGDRVRCFVHPDGSVVQLPKVPVSALRGMLRPRRSHVAIEDMDAAIAAGISAVRTDGRKRGRKSSRTPR